MSYVDIKTADDGTLSVEGSPFTLVPNQRSSTAYRVLGDEAGHRRAIRHRTSSGPDDWRLVTPQEPDRWFSGCGGLFHFLATGEEPEA